MTTETREFEIVRTNSGLPAMEENGGGLTHRGYSQIICSEDGSKLRSLVPTYGRALERHALLVIKEGYNIILVSRWNEELKILVYSITNITDTKCLTKKIHSYIDGCWDKEPPEGLDAPIKAAVDKTRIFHCREAVYANEPKKRY